MSLSCPKCGYKFPEDSIKDEVRDRYVQIQNPKSGWWTLIDKQTGEIKGNYKEQVPLVSVKGKGSEGDK